MAFDFSCWQLESCISAPVEDGNLEHWRRLQKMRAAMFESWKRIDDKTVSIDGVKYKLVPVAK